MAELPITDNPEFRPTLRKLEITDRAHASLFNGINQALLDNDNYIKAGADRMKGTRTIVLPSSGWSASAPYTQTVQVPGVTEEDTPIIALHLPAGTNYEGEKAAKKAYSCISWVDTGSGTITATCLGKKPATDIQLMIKGV